MRHTNRHTPIRVARAVAAPRTNAAPAVLSALILSLIVLLLSGAAWMQLT